MNIAKQCIFEPVEPPHQGRIVSDLPPSETTFTVKSIHV